MAEKGLLGQRITLLSFLKVGLPTNSRQFDPVGFIFMNSHTSEEVCICCYRVGAGVWWLE